MERAGYDLTAEHEARHWWFGSRRRLVLAQVERAAREVGAAGRRLSLLDFGCGTGFNLRFLAAYGDVTGGDAFTEEVDRVSKRQDFPYLDLAGDLTGERGRFDLVTALDVIEHAEDDVALLQRIGDLMTASGRAVLTVPAYQWLWSGEDVVSRHFRRYTATSLRAALEAAGFEVLFLSYFNLSVLPGIAAVILARRWLFPASRDRSGLEIPVGPLNGLLGLVTGWEAGLVGSETVRMPAGASLVCRVRKRCGK